MTRQNLATARFEPTGADDNGLANRIRAIAGLSTTTRRALLIEGQALILAQDESGADAWLRYSEGDLIEIFSEQELLDLAGGRVVFRHSRHGASRYVNMLAAARDQMDNG